MVFEPDLASFRKKSPVLSHNDRWSRMNTEKGSGRPPPSPPKQQHLNALVAFIFILRVELLFLNSWNIISGRSLLKGLLISQLKRVALSRAVCKSYWHATLRILPKKSDTLRPLFYVPAILKKIGITYFK